MQGYDFCTIHEKTLENLNLIKTKGMPRLLEIETFRYNEHVGPGDDFKAGYRSSSAFENWKSKDPLINDKESIKKFLPEIEEEIQNAVNFAEQSPWPGSEELLTDVI